MRAFLVSLLLLTAAASRAQPAPDREDLVRLTIGGLVGGAALGYLAAPGVLDLQVDDASALLRLEVGATMGIAGGVILARRLSEIEGSDRGALGGAALGGAIVVGGTAGFLLLDAGQTNPTEVLAYAVAATVVVPTALAIRGALVLPAALPSPTGERTTGFSLTLSL